MIADLKNQAQEVEAKKQKEQQAKTKDTDQ